MQDAHGPFRGEQRLTGRLDFTELDAVTAQLDLGVGPAEELQGAVVPEPSQVAGAVPAASFVDDELVLRESGVVNVSPGHTEPADPQLADDVVRAVPPGGVDHAVGLAIQRAPVGDGHPFLGNLIDVESVRPDRGLGGPSHREQAAAGRERPHPCRQAHVDPVAGKQDVAQARQRARVLFGAGQKHLEQHGNRVPHGDAVRLNRPEPVVGVSTSRLGNRHQRPPGAESAEGVVDREVEVEGRDAQDRILGA